MIINLSIELPDEVSKAEVAAYLREQADNTAGQLEQNIIDLPEIDEPIMMDCGDDREAILFRSE